METLTQAVSRLNATLGQGFITEVHRNGSGGIAFRKLWGGKIDFINFSIMRTAEGEFVRMMDRAVIFS